MPTPFETHILPRLRASASSEASRVVLDLVASGRKLPDAVADAVESMPWKDTADVRRWTENWEAGAAWLRCEAAGWKLAKATKSRVIVIVPESKWRTMYDVLRKPVGGQVYAPLMRGTARGATIASYTVHPGLLRAVGGPSEAAVAAAGDVGAVVVRNAEADYTSTKNWRLVFNVTRQK
jgi:hypothetical protein